MQQTQSSRLSNRFSDWESHDANFAPEFLGLLKPPESNSLVSDSQKHYRKNFIACAIKFLNCPVLRLCRNPPLLFVLTHRKDGEYPRACAIFFCTTVLCSFQSTRSADSAPVHHAVMRVSGRMVGASRRRGLYAEYPRHRFTRPQKILKEFFGWFTGPPPHAIAWGGIFAKPDKMRKRFVILSEVEKKSPKAISVDLGLAKANLLARRRQDITYAWNRVRHRW